MELFHDFESFSISSLRKVLKATEKNESYVGKMNQMQVETTLVRLFWNFYGVVSNKNLSIYM